MTTLKNSSKYQGEIIIKEQLTKRSEERNVERERRGQLQKNTEKAKLDQAGWRQEKSDLWLLEANRDKLHLNIT